MPVINTVIKGGNGQPVEKFIAIADNYATSLNIGDNVYLNEGMGTSNYQWTASTTNYTNSFNYNVYGNPTISENYIVSNFTANNQIGLTIPFLTSTNTWEIVTAINITSAPTSDYCGINFVTSGSPAVATSLTNQRKLRWWLSSNGTSWNMVSGGTGTKVFDLNTNYLIKVAFSGTQYTFQYSEDDGVNWITDLTYSSTTTIYQSDTLGTLGSRGGAVPFTGTIDLTKSYIKINDEIVWNPVSSSAPLIPEITNFTITNRTLISSTKVASNFSTSNFLTTNKAFTPLTNTWEMNFKIKTASSTATNDKIIIDRVSDVVYGPIIRLGSGNILKLWIATSSSTWGVSGATSILTLANSTVYYLKLYYTGTQYLLDVSTDNETWTNYITSNVSTTMYTNGYLARIGYGIDSQGFTGEIYLEDCNIKINNELWWKPYAGYNQWNQEFTVTGTISEKETLINGDVLLTIGSSNINEKTTTIVSSSDRTITGYTGNFTNIGGVTISEDWIASGFSSSKYLQIGTVPFNSATNWEIGIKVTTGNDVTTDQYLIADEPSSYSNLIKLNNAKFGFNVSSNHTYHFAAQMGTTTITANTEYWIKFQFTGSRYILSLSLDGQTWNEECSASSSTKISTSVWDIGGTSGYYVWDGSVDLNESYIKINGEDWWISQTPIYTYDYTINNANDGGIIHTIGDMTPRSVNVNCDIDNATIATNSYYTTKINAIPKEYKIFKIGTITPSDASLFLNVNGQQEFNKEILIKAGSGIGILASKYKYVPYRFCNAVYYDKKITINLTPMVDLKIETTPVDSEIVYEYSGSYSLKMNDNTIRVPENSSVHWAINKYGFTTQVGTEALTTTDVTLQKTLEEQVTFTANPRPFDSTVELVCGAFPNVLNTIPNIDKGNTVSYTISSYGYEILTGDYVINNNYNLDGTLTSTTNLTAEIDSSASTKIVNDIVNINAGMGTENDYVAFETITPRNFTMYGNTIISEDEIVSNFSANNYISTSSAIEIGSNNWEVQVKFQLTDIASNSRIFSMNGVSEPSFILGFNSSKLLYWASSNGTSWNMASSATGTNTLELGIMYLAKIIYNGSNYVISISSDNGVTWITDYTISSSTPIFNPTTVAFFGKQNDYSINGYIDLASTYINVNNEIVWQAFPTSKATIAENNFTKVGTLYITKDNVVSNFSSSNYILLNKTFNFVNSKWEVATKFKLSAYSSGNRIFSSCGASGTPYIFVLGTKIPTNKLHFWYSFDGTTWNEKTGQIPISLNTDYYVKVIFDGIKYVVKLSSDNNYWQDDIIIYDNTQLYSTASNPPAFGVHDNNVLNGSIDLNYTYININNEKYWTPFKSKYEGITTEESKIVSIDSINNTLVGSPKKHHEYDITITSDQSDSIIKTIGDAEIYDVTIVADQSNATIGSETYIMPQINIIPVEYRDIKFNITPADATVDLNIAGQSLTYSSTNDYWVKSGKGFGYKISKVGYETKFNVQPSYYSKTWSDSLTQQMVTYAIVANPSDATVTLTADGYTQTDNYITVPYGTSVIYSVAKDGYVTQSSTQLVEGNLLTTITLTTV